MHDKIASVIGTMDPEQQEGYRQIRVQQRFARALQLWQEFPGVLRLQAGYDRLNLSPSFTSKRAPNSVEFPCSSCQGRTLLVGLRNGFFGSSDPWFAMVETIFTSGLADLGCGKCFLSCLMYLKSIDNAQPERLAIFQECPRHGSGAGMHWKPIWSPLAREEWSLTIPGIRFGTRLIVLGVTMSLRLFISPAAFSTCGSMCFTAAPSVTWCKQAIFSTRNSSLYAYPNPTD